MIGIVLNVTCNIESAQVTEYLLGLDTMRILALILVDQRHDWPTNGAALALLQYAHHSLQNSELYLRLEEANITTILNNFINECRNQETKRHMYEAIAFLEMSRQKMHGIIHIHSKCVFAACA